MKNKLLLVLASALTVTAVSSHAQTSAPAPAVAPSYTLTATATAVSQYMFRGQRLGGWSFQPAVEYASGNFGLGVWSNFPVKDEVPDTSDPEFDLYGYYTLPVNDAVSVVPAFTYYYYPNAPIGLGFYRGTFEPSIALNYTTQGLKLTPKLYYDVTLRGPTFELNAFYAVPLKDFGTELDFTAAIGSYLLKDIARDRNPKTKAWGDYWSVGVAMPFQISSAGKLTLGWSYAEGRKAYFKTGNAGRVPNALAVGRGVVSISYAHSF